MSLVSIVVQFDTWIFSNHTGFVKFGVIIKTPHTTFVFASRTLIIWTVKLTVLLEYLDSKSSKCSIRVVDQINEWASLIHLSAHFSDWTGTQVFALLYCMFYATSASRIIKAEGGYKI